MTPTDIIIDNITEIDQEKRIIRVLKKNKPIFPLEKAGRYLKYKILFYHEDKIYDAIYTVGSIDRKSRSGILKLEDNLYLNILKITAGIILNIRYIDNGKYLIYLKK